MNKINKIQNRITKLQIELAEAAVKLEINNRSRSIIPSANSHLNRHQSNTRAHIRNLNKKIAGERAKLDKIRSSKVN